MKPWCERVPETEQEKIRQYLNKRVEQSNAEPGKLNVDFINTFGVLVKGDGIDCPKCRNRGSYMTIIENDIYGPEMRLTICKCAMARNNIRRMQRSGLLNSVKQKRFDNFDTATDYQKTMVETAKEYVECGASDGKWLYMGGAVGCGKTHLCTAVAGELLKTHELKHIVWPQAAKKIKALSTYADQYEEAISALQNVDILYIDDFFKTGHLSDAQAVKDADVRLGFEILNYRYNNQKPTIITSEWLIDELGEIDDAIASRIFEQCSGYLINVCRDRERNYRFRRSNIV